MVERPTKLKKARLNAIGTTISRIPVKFSVVIRRLP
jgi:hypothetical protein